MFIPENSSQYNDSFPTETAISKNETLLDNTESGSNWAPMRVFQKENLSVNQIEENGFYSKG